MPDTEHGYFEGIYAAGPDPWGFDERWYEHRKYALTLAALPFPRARCAVEPGCANGAFTELLADRCDELIAFDFVDQVVDRAARRLRDRPNVHVRRARFPEYWPDGTGDLVVWSEIAYYLADDSADRAITGLQRWLEPGGALVAVHYTGATDYARKGGAIRPWLDAVDFLQRTSLLVDEEFELGVWTRPVT
jgi:cyclopropane fatty-acyl-phospholipid synthase-like methyltransferase